MASLRRLTSLFLTGLDRALRPGPADDPGSKGTDDTKPAQAKVKARPRSTLRAKSVPSSRTTACVSRSRRQAAQGGFAARHQCSVDRLLDSPRDNVVENPARIHDLNATILHCLGIDHRRLSFKFQGLDMRLTGVEEHSPIKGILV